MLTGVRTADELRANLAAIDAGPLPQDVLKRLDEIRDLVPFRPTLEPFYFSFDGETIGHPKLY